MTVARDFANNNKLTDYTDQVLLIPNEYGMINRMGLFTSKGITQNSTTFDRTVESLAVLSDKTRGERQNYGKDGDNKTHSAAVPHFPLDDFITVDDVQGVRRNGTADQAETVANVRATKLERIRKSHGATVEKARMEAIMGKLYNPNGTSNVTNWYTEFGVTPKVISSELDQAGTDVIAVNEEGIAHIQDNIGDGNQVDEVVVLCSPTYFAALISQEGVVEAYRSYLNSNQAGGGQVARDRIVSGMNRTLNHGGATYVEYRASYGGIPLIPAGEAYMVPMGVDGLFESQFSPAYKLSLANTIGEELYVFETEMGNDTGWKLESESSHIHIPKRPEAVVKFTLT